MEQILIPLGLLILAFFTGRAAENSHFKRLQQREEAMRDILLSDLKRFPGGADGKRTPSMVVGQVVIATDYLKTFIANIKHILGGELKTYDKLLERARREAICRMMEQARQLGYDAVCNIRIEFSNIGSNTGNRKHEMVTVEAMAYGTGYCRTGQSAYE